MRSNVLTLAFLSTVLPLILWATGVARKAASFIKHDESEPWLDFVVFHARARLNPPLRVRIPPGPGFAFERTVVVSRTSPPFAAVLPSGAVDRVISWTVEATGLWDPPLTAACARALSLSPRGSVALDVGGHAGWFGLLAA